MPTPQEYARQFASRLGGAQGAAAAAMMPGLQALIDAMPAYGNHEFQTLHRGALVNLLESYLPNAAIVAQGGSTSMGGSVFYDYNGPYSGYRQAFYGNVVPSSAASNLAEVVRASSGGLNAEYWSKYGVAALTDAVRQTVGGDVDTGKLSTDLETYNKAFLPALAASYYAVFSHDFGPTAAALGALRTSGQTARANTELCERVAAGLFTANINQAIGMGGDGAMMAGWFLFNLWMTLKALGNPDVDGAIRRFKEVGLTVPPQLGPGKWWNGGYTSWWFPLSGSDVAGAAQGTIRAAMPERQGSTSPSHGGVGGNTYFTNATAPNGYSWSLINWGSLSWYKPQSSCFGRGTGVLMADGSVEVVERVKTGDVVQSDEGPKKVLLVVAPLRAGRPFYAVNGLNVYCTAGHPFRLPEGAGPARAAVDPWAVIDGVATMTERGVATLGPGVSLSARGANGEEEVTVVRLDKFDAAAEGDERVYDLVLEGNEAGASRYYVGGPDTFLAVDTEWPDPSHDPQVTHAIMTAMETALPACRESLKGSVTRLPDILNRVQLGAVLSRASEAALPVPQGTKAQPKFEPDFFTHEGEWDPHASALGHSLVRRFARTMRREMAAGWRASATTTPQPDDRLAVVVHDVQLLGDVSVGPGAKLGVELRLRGWDSTGDIVRGLESGVGARPAWHVAPDEVLEFGQIPQTSNPASLLGRVTLDGLTVGEFLLTLNGQELNGGTEEHFLFGGGKVVGRIALEPRRNSARDLTREREQREAWASHHTQAVAEHLGGEIVRHLVRAGG